jgi:alkanesulfonate monooxygenase SsuD/methylene tetrahydromethanopterin reductase-like flavin-dependent oxidoreductase (luciferase family)
MPRIGLMLSDVPASVPVQQQFSDLLRYAEAAQRNGFSHLALGQHFLYGDLRWLQPVPVLARLAAEMDPGVGLVTNIVIGTFYHPVILAEELATLDIVTEGRLIVGLGAGYRPEEFGFLGLPTTGRGARLDETIDLVKRLWTEDRVDHDGRFYRLEGGTPHIRPWQDPHPPIWIGGHSEAGARRAGRIGDGLLIPPGATRLEISERIRVMREEREAAGRVFTTTPLRRNVRIEATREEAVTAYARVAGDRYRTYARRGLDVYGSHDDLVADFAGMVEGHAVLGSPEDVVAELVDLAEAFPVDPIIVRCGWPSMTADETIEQMDLMGRHVIPALG